MLWITLSSTLLCTSSHGHIICMYANNIDSQSELDDEHRKSAY
jgi:hypothetical protein